MGQVNSVGDNIVQSTQFVSKDGKFEMLVDALREHDQSAIVFMNSKFATEKMAKRLKSAGITAEAIHGDLRQSKRERVISNLRDNKFRVLVATDVAARGSMCPIFIRSSILISRDKPKITFIASAERAEMARRASH